jgi:hypothetical protein
MTRMSPKRKIKKKSKVKLRFKNSLKGMSSKNCTLMISISRRGSRQNLKRKSRNLPLNPNSRKRRRREEKANLLSQRKRPYLQQTQRRKKS